MATEINAITVVITDMTTSVGFYTDLGFEIAYGGPDSTFTSLKIGSNFVNLQHTGVEPGVGWGRVIFHVDSPDAVHDTAIAAGHAPEFAPSDAPWGERYFHIRDPDGHELSFARRLHSD
ncbi:MAG: VOC family protein [Actinomycetota bacterium]